MNIFAIETSCDETAAAIVENGTREIVSVVASSKDLHQKTGGVVPEVAARKQVETIVPVIAETLKQFEKLRGDAVKKMDMIAVTVGPGLIGSLLVGVEAAKALSLAWNKPLVPVNHLLGHIYANWIGVSKEFQEPEFPAIAFVVSGGHTDLVLMRDHGGFEFLGGTLDDAAGEAFDKTARLLGLRKYLGGAQLSKLATTCEKNTFVKGLPRPMLDKDNYDFSFSGLKTAVKRIVASGEYSREVVACEFENAVVDVLVAKALKAVKEYSVKSFLLGGGVAANVQLRTRLKSALERQKVTVYIPQSYLCGDNAVYIAAAAYFLRNHVDELSNIKMADITANPSLGIVDFM